MYIRRINAVKKQSLSGAWWLWIGWEHRIKEASERIIEVIEKLG